MCSDESIIEYFTCDHILLISLYFDSILTVILTHHDYSLWNDVWYVQLLFFYYICNKST